MKKYKNKILRILLCTLFILTIFQSAIFAANNYTQILKKTKNEYLIYRKELLNSDFEFAFSNDENVAETELNFINSAKDDEGNSIAYIDENLKDKFFSKDTYMWIRQNEEIIVKAEKLDLLTAIETSELEAAKNITQKISVDTSSKIKNIETVNEVEITTTMGMIKITDDANAEYEYQLVSLSNGKEYNKLVGLAREVKALTAETPIYDRTAKVKEFYDLYSKLLPEANGENWIKVENNQIIQPEESEKGEEYLLWLKKTDAEGNIVQDLQILQCDRTENEVSKIENVETQVTVKLPITGDNIVLFVILGIVIILIVVLVIMKKRNDKKEKKA